MLLYLNFQYKLQASFYSFCEKFHTQTYKPQFSHCKFFRKLKNSLKIYLYILLEIPHFQNAVLIQFERF